MNNFYSKLSLQVIFVFAVIIISTFIPDQFHSFFGDQMCSGNLIGGDNSYRCSDGWTRYQYPHQGEWHWGARHYLWCMMGIVLFILQCFRIGNIINDESKKH